MDFFCYIYSLFVAFLTYAYLSVCLLLVQGPAGFEPWPEDSGLSSLAVLVCP